MLLRIYIVLKIIIHLTMYLSKYYFVTNLFRIYYGVLRTSLLTFALGSAANGHPDSSRVFSRRKTLRSARLETGIPPVGPAYNHLASIPSIQLSPIFLLCSLLSSLLSFVFPPYFLLIFSSCPPVVDLPSFLHRLIRFRAGLFETPDWSRASRAIASSIFLRPRCYRSPHNEQALRLSKGLFSLPPRAQRLLHIAQSVRNGPRRA
jgi:hypothetical protein